MNYWEVFAIAMFASVLVLIMFIGTIALLNYLDEKRELRRIEIKANRKYIERLEREDECKG